MSIRKWGFFGLSREREGELVLSKKKPGDSRAGIFWYRYGESNPGLMAENHLS